LPVLPILFKHSLDACIANSVSTCFSSLYFLLVVLPELIPNPLLLLFFIANSYPTFFSCLYCQFFSNILLLPVLPILFQHALAA